jgi:hypothetical protein
LFPRRNVKQQKGTKDQNPAFQQVFAGNQPHANDPIGRPKNAIDRIASMIKQETEWTRRLSPSGLFAIHIVEGLIGNHGNSVPQEDPSRRRLVKNFQRRHVIPIERIRGYHPYQSNQSDGIGGNGTGQNGVDTPLGQGRKDVLIYERIVTSSILIVWQLSSRIGIQVVKAISVVLVFIWLFRECRIFGCPRNHALTSVEENYCMKNAPDFVLNESLCRVEI